MTSPGAPSRATPLPKGPGRRPAVRAVLVALLLAGLGPALGHASPASPGAVPPGRGDLAAAPARDLSPVVSAGRAIAEAPPAARPVPAADPPPSIEVGTEPLTPVYDTRDGTVYVPNGDSNNVSVLAGTTLAGTVAVGGGPEFGTYDPQNDAVYVPNQVSNNVSVLIGLQVVASVNVGSEPSYAAYDGANGLVYVANLLSNNVSVLNGTVLAGTVHVGSGPVALAADSLTGLVYVANSGSDNVSVLNGSRLVATLAVGGDPDFVLYDPQDGYVYVLNAPAFVPSATVTVLSGTTVEATVHVGSDPEGAVFDPASSAVYVANYGSNNVSILRGTRLLATVNAGVEPNAATYDGGDQEVYVTDSGSNSVTVINGTYPVATRGVGTGPEGDTYAVDQGIVYVANFGSSNVTVLRTGVPYDVNVTESGLPSGTPWWVNLTGGLSGTSSSGPIRLHATNGTYPYTVATANRSYEAAGGSFVVHGQPLDANVNFSAVLFTLNFSEAGLPNGTAWSVTVGGSSNRSTEPWITLPETNGSYAYDLQPATNAFHANVSTGELEVDGAGLNISVAFLANTSYELYFYESTLLGGTPWNVTLDGLFNSTNASVLGFQVYNGTYDYEALAGGYVAVPPTGSVIVHGAPSVATPVVVTFAFAQPHYTIEFQESGLPNGTPWSLGAGGWNEPFRDFNNTSTAGAAILASAPNGSYFYHVGPTPGFTTPRSGAFQVAGGPVTVSILFVPFTYVVTFRETGLAAGLGWTVRLGGVAENATGPTLVLLEPNGSYTFSLGTLAGYRVPGNGTFSVQGAPVTVSNLQFVAEGSSSPGGSSLLYEELAVAAGALLVLAGVGAWRLRRRPPSPPGGQAEAPAPREGGTTDLDEPGPDAVPP